MQIAPDNPYAGLMQYQKPDLITIPEIDPPTISPETELKVKEKIVDRIGEIGEKAQEQKDNLRAMTAQYVGNQSKKTQWEIYLQGMESGEIDPDEGMSGIEFYDTLRQMQEQNNRIKAYGAYQGKGGEWERPDE